VELPFCCAGIVFDAVYSYRCTPVSRQMRKRSTHLLGRAKAGHTTALSRARGSIVIHWPTSKSTRDRTNVHAAAYTRQYARFVRLGRRRRRCSCPSDRDPALVRAAVLTVTARPGRAGTACAGESRTAHHSYQDVAGHGLCPGRLVCSNKSGEQSVVRVDHPCC
jgi:hypothetical protein